MPGFKFSFGPELGTCGHATSSSKPEPSHIVAVNQQKVIRDSPSIRTASQNSYMRHVEYV
jgi:hypothetical protein